MLLACFGAWACQGTACMRQCTVKEAFDRRQPMESWKLKNVRRILWLKQHLYVMLVETPNLRRMRSIRCLSSTDIVHSAPKESTGDFVDVSRKVVDDGRWANFQIIWLRGCVRILKQGNRAWCATNVSPRNLSLPRRRRGRRRRVWRHQMHSQREWGNIWFIVNERLRRPSFCCANTTCKVVLYEETACEKAVLVVL